MLNVSATILRFGAALVVALLLSSIASAQFTKLDEAGEQLAKKLKPLKPALVAVADFNSPDGSATGAAHYFSWYLSFAMEDSGKKRFHVADHLTFDRDLERILGGPSVPVTPERLHDATQRIGADVVILGTVVKRGASYVFEISPFKLADSAGLPTIRTTIQDSGFLESLAAPFPSRELGQVEKGGVDGVGLPSCIRCPDPTYNELARLHRIQGVSVFLVLISSEGRPLQMKPKKMIGYGLDEQAFNAIRNWKFKPAKHKADDKPVSVIVPVEVTFRMF